VAIREGNVMSMAAMKGAKLEFTETHQRAAGDVVIGWGLYRVTTQGADGKTTGMNGRYTDVKAERDGKWVYLMDHASVPMQTGQ
jgi:ketosteroid isomerase-like protein